MVTGTGRKKIVMQDVLDKIEQTQLAYERHDHEGAEQLKSELQVMVLKAIKDGDFQGLTARVAARWALSVPKVDRN